MNRLKMTMLTCVVAIVLTTLVLTPKVVGAAPLTCGTWSVVSSPNAGSGSNDLDGVAAVSASNGWAVGYTFNSNAYQTLIEHWNGTSWSVVASPNVGSNYNELLSVSAVSARNVWAVGYSSSSSIYQTLIEHWNGTTWKVLPSPNVGTGNNILYAVAVVSANNVWAVGISTINFNTDQTLIEHWNGTSWSVVASPNVGSSSNDLTSVARVPGSTAVWAVGYSQNTSNSPVQTLIEQWNGTSWSVVPSPNVGTNYNKLYGVAPISASNVWAVGNIFTSSNINQTLIEQWNGTSWSIVPSTNVGSSYNFLDGVAAVSASNVWSVGAYFNTSSNAFQTLIEQWNGTSWSVVASPNVGSATNILYAVARVGASSKVWSVGAYRNSSNIDQTLTDFYC